MQATDLAIAKMVMGVDSVLFRPDDELKNLVMRMVPGVIRQQLVFKMASLRSWIEIKGCIHEMARILVVYGGKSVPAHVVEPFDVLSVLTDDVMEKTDGWSFEEQVL